MKDIIKKVSSGGVLYHEGKYLVIKWQSQGTTELPKGTIEKGETPEQACIREMFEETGYNVKIIHSLGESTFTFNWKDGNTYQKTVHYFLMIRTDNAIATPHREEGEDFENEWLTFEQAYKNLSHDDSKQILKKAQIIVTSENL